MYFVHAFTQYARSASDIQGVLHTLFAKICRYLAFGYKCTESKTPSLGTTMGSLMPRCLQRPSYLERTCWKLTASSLGHLAGKVVLQVKYACS